MNFVRLYATVIALLNRISAFTAVFLVVATTLSSQTVTLPREEVGMYVAGALNLHGASFSKLGDVQSCCPEFTGAVGFGSSAGLFYTYAFSETWRVQARLTYADRSATLTDTETSFVADLRDSAKVVEALFTHELAASITDIGLEPLLLFRPTGRLDLMLGARLALPIISEFHQTETLTEPAEYGTYLGNDRVYVDTSGDIPSFPSPQFSIVLGLRYVIPLRIRGVTFIAPELHYSIPVTGVSDNIDWSVSHLRFGFQIGFLNPPNAPATEYPPATKTPVEPPPVASAPPAVIPETPPTTSGVSVIAKGITVDGLGVDNVTVHVEEIAATEIVPLLPHVYFDSASTTLISAQLNARAAFEANPEGMNLETAIHAGPWLLAKRLAEQPTAKVRLVGTTSDEGSDKGLPLARERAQSVKDALVAQGVNAAAITIEARRHPAKPTVASDSTQHGLAAAENRRVEIIVSDPSILAPFTLHSVERSVDPPTMRAYLQSENLDSIDRWTVYVHQGPTRMASFYGTGALPGYVAWNLADSGIPATELPIEVELSVDAAGAETPALASDTVSVSQLTIRKKRIERIAGREIERLNLLLFEFNDTRVGPENAKLIEEVRAKITPETEVTVYGLTDELGAAAYNRDLSSRRAAEVASILNVPQARIVGTGEESPKYRSLTPVARGYNRTVVIELVTPVR